MPYGPFYLKDKRALDFIFKRIKNNNEENKKEWTYISPCGQEINFIKCFDTPIVFQSIERNEENEKEEFLNFAGNLKIKFDVNKLRVNKNSGRIYHLIDPSHSGVSPDLTFGLIRSTLAIEFSKHFVVEGENIFFNYQNENILLPNF